MDCLLVKVKAKSIFAIFLLAVHFANCINANYRYDVDGIIETPNMVQLDHIRQRRDLPAPPAPTTIATPPIAASAPVSQQPEATSTATAIAAQNATVQNNDENRTTNNIKTTVPPPAMVTKVPLLGVNGSGQLHVNPANSANTPKVSDPILPDDNLTAIIKETPEMIKAEQNLTDLKYDNHSFYNSFFVGNKSFFNEHWANITKLRPDVHPVLSNSHRRATTLKLTFDFPFYGHPLRNITVATGGFIYTGEHVHNWLAATQYIAPLMANFDTTISNDSLVKLYDDGEKFTALWENVNLQEDKNKKFTFAVTLYKNGNIYFAYKDIPMPIQSINDSEHPVKVGISDAYLTDKIMFYVRRKTIYEYHRVTFKNYEITNGTVLMLVALPTCVQYNSCDTCVNHDTGFNCSWCEAIQRCSSGTDRNKQDWMLRNCDKVPISNATYCPARAHDADPETGNTAYVTDTQGNPMHDAVINTNGDTQSRKAKMGTVNAPAVSAADSSPVNAPVTDDMRTQVGRSPIGGVIAGFVAIILVSGLGAWLFYAFKNPHTRSGQMLIKYRPSQWSWRRGEARYTAATIHM